MEDEEEEESVCGKGRTGEEGVGGGVGGSSKGSNVGGVERWVLVVVVVVG